jgi:hypothetical protein
VRAWSCVELMLRIAPLSRHDVHENHEVDDDYTTSRHSDDRAAVSAMMNVQATCESNHSRGYCRAGMLTALFGFAGTPVVQVDPERTLFRIKMTVCSINLRRDRAPSSKRVTPGL